MKKVEFLVNYKEANTNPDDALRQIILEANRLGIEKNSLKDIDSIKIVKKFGVGLQVIFIFENSR